MIYIYSEDLEKKLSKKINSFYVLLGKDLILLNNNQDLIIQFAKKIGFQERIKINVSQHEDWEKIFNFYTQKTIFFKKSILIIDFLISMSNIKTMKNVNKIFLMCNSDIIVIIKLNQLSQWFKINILSKIFQNNINVVHCSTPHNTHLNNWIKYEIQKKNINIENTAITLLKKYYEGEIFFIYKILEILPMIWPNSLITRRHIKKIISNFSSFSAYHWINAIFNYDKKKALYILNIFHKKKYTALILIRALQKKLLTLIIEKRKKHFTNKKLLKKQYVCTEKRKHLKQIDQNRHHNIFFYAIKILVQIEIKIKKQYSYSIWMQLKKLTLILCTYKKTRQC